MTEPILDFHMHAYPAHLAQKAVGDVFAKLGIPSAHDGRIASLADAMRRSGVTHGVLQNIASKPGHSTNTNAFALSAQQEYAAPGAPQIYSFAGLHPHEENWRETLGNIRAAGFKGVKFQPTIQGFCIDDPLMETVIGEIFASGLVLLIHAGWEINRPDFDNSSARRIANILPVLEKGRTVIAHMGGINKTGEFLEQTVFEKLCGRNVYFDTSISLLYNDAEVVREIFRRHGPGRILFGSDTPWNDQKKAIDFLQNDFAPSFLSREDLRNVLWNNGAALLGLPDGGHAVKQASAAFA